MFTQGSIELREDLTDRRAVVAMIIAYTTSAAMLGEQFARRLGGSTFYDPQVYARYGMASLELFTHGVLADDAILQAMKASIASALIADPDPPRSA